MNLSMCNIIRESSELQNPITISHVSDFIITLKQNLKKSGVKTAKLSGILNNIAGAYLSDLSLFMFGKDADAISQIISVSICGKIPLMIELKTGYGNYYELCHTLENITDEVIVIKNAIGYIDESVYVHLNQDLPSHYFIFINDSNEMINYLPAGILSNIVMIYCGNILSNTKDNVEYTSSILSLEDETIEYEPHEYNKYYKNINIFSKHAELTNGYNASRSKLLITLNFYLNKPETYLSLIPEMVYFTILHDRKKEFIQLMIEDDNSNDNAIDIAEDIKL